MLWSCDAKPPGQAEAACFEAKDIKSSSLESGTQGLDLKGVVAGRELRKARPSVIVRRPLLGLRLPVLVCVHRAVHSNHQAAESEYSCCLTNHVFDWCVVKRSREQRGVGRTIAQRQPAHVGSHVEGVRSSLDVQHIDGDDIRLLKVARRPATPGSDVEENWRGPRRNWRQERCSRRNSLQSRAPQPWRAAARILAASRSDPTLLQTQCLVLRSEAVGVGSKRVVQQVQAATSGDNGPAAPRAPRDIWFWGCTAARTRQQAIEASGVLISEGRSAPS